MNNQAKGNALEDAVRQIETCILKSNPSLSGLPITIESKKIIISEGVRHEIDLYVEIEHGHGYKSIFIFECKNWAKPVGKNHIIIFSEKIKETNAQQGFFIAGNFTEDAISQSAKDARLELVAYEHNEALISEFTDFHVIERLDTHFVINLMERGYRNKEADFQSLAFDINTSSILFSGYKFSLKNHVYIKIEKMIDDGVNQEPTSEWPEGLYNIEYSAFEEFTKNQLVIDNRDIEVIEYKVSFLLKLRRPIIEYVFDIDGRGKAIKFSDTGEKGDQITMTRKE